MAHLAPEKLWKRHVLERFEAFKQSGGLKKLRKEGLVACGRKKRFTSLEWAKSPMRDRFLSSRYMAWYNECETAARRFGLATETVVCACLISGYRPDKAPFPVESPWPQIRVITESTDSQFLTRLAYEAQSRGLHVIMRQGSIETQYLFMNPLPLMYIEPPPLPVAMPTAYDAFSMRVETPVGYPLQAAKKLHQMARQLERDILKALGYSIPKRLRVSRLVSKANVLRIWESRLPKRGLYEIVANNFDEGSVDEDEKRRKTIKTQRHKLRKRLVKPFESESD